MTAVNELLDNVKIRLNLASDMALAERLTVTRSLVSRWRKGDTPLADERIAQICALAKLDGPTWIAMIHAERATSATERALWRLMLDRMSAAAAVVALVALSMPGLANAKTAQIQAVSGGLLTHSVYYVQSIPGDAGVPFASIPSRPGSYGFLHRPIRVLCMPQAIQPQTKPPPRDNDLFLFKGGSIQSLIGHESQRSQ
ncbi:TPA: hypothetical protein RNS57_000218 [Stenotrophomonas maltophilia]|nr:hypothetical protein [Stenotrophomonas maltophilia]HDX0796216.1 hypothetical protein [Stenotrophomonas maltophilia]HDX0942102.1 hypothetical protein [Stenotrophomonas maltophilia]